MKAQQLGVGECGSFLCRYHHLNNIDRIYVIIRQSLFHCYSAINLLTLTFKKNSMLNKLKDLITYKRIKEHLLNRSDKISDDDIKNAKVDFGIEDMIKDVEKSKGVKGIGKPRTRPNY